jgi:Xaa-Pro aminopeptidase
LKSKLVRSKTLLDKYDVQAVLVTKPENRLYWSGFTGSAGALVLLADQGALFTDFRYIEQATKQAPDFEIVRQGPDFWESLAIWLKSHDIQRLAFEKDFFTVELYEKLQQAVPFLALCPVKLDEWRRVKDEAELALITKAVEIADQAFEQTLPVIRPGATELTVAVELEHAMRKLGSMKPAFDTIVASGIRGSLPHAQPTTRELQVGDFVTMDFGAVYEGYHSDITRTVCVGRASDKQKALYKTVLSAQLAGIAAISAGKACDVIDGVARKIIESAGYGECFGHGLGHSVGLFIHEEPRLSPTCDTILAENMVITVEPGIYVPGFGGVRIEDLVVVSCAGCKILTASRKELIELDCN